MIFPAQKFQRLLLWILFRRSQITYSTPPSSCPYPAGPTARSRMRPWASGPASPQNPDCGPLFPRGFVWADTTRRLVKLLSLFCHHSLCSVLSLFFSSVLCLFSDFGTRQTGSHPARPLTLTPASSSADNNAAWLRGVLRGSEKGCEDPFRTDPPWNVCSEFSTPHCPVGCPRHRPFFILPLTASCREK